MCRGNHVHLKDLGAIRLEVRAEGVRQKRREDVTPTKRQEKQNRSALDSEIEVSIQALNPFNKYEKFPLRKVILVYSKAHRKHERDFKRCFQTPHL